MKVTRLPDVEPRPRRVAVGTFDGVHLGHREVIRGADTVLTFEPHPAAIVSPAGAPRLLTPLERKVELIAELGDGYCEELRRTRVGPFDVADADPVRVLPLERALSFLPVVALDADTAWRAGHGQSIPGEADAEHVLLADADGPVAIAQPRPDGSLKPVVGFRE